MTGCSRLVAMEFIVMAIALGCTTPAVAQDIPPDALHCNLRSPPETAYASVTYYENGNPRIQRMENAAWDFF